MAGSPDQKRGFFGKMFSRGESQTSGTETTPHTIYATSITDFAQKYRRNSFSDRPSVTYVIGEAIQKEGEAEPMKAVDVSFGVTQTGKRLLYTADLHLVPLSERPEDKAWLTAALLAEIIGQTTFIQVPHPSAPETPIGRMERLPKIEELQKEGIRAYPFAEILDRMNPPGSF